MQHILHVVRVAVLRLNILDLLSFKAYFWTTFKLFPEQSCRFYVWFIQYYKEALDIRNKNSVEIRLDKKKHQLVMELESSTPTNLLERNYPWVGIKLIFVALCFFVLSFCSIFLDTREAAGIKHLELLIPLSIVPLAFFNYLSYGTRKHHLRNKRWLHLQWKLNWSCYHFKFTNNIEQ